MLVGPEAFGGVVAGGEVGDEGGGFFVDLGGVAEGEAALAGYSFGLLGGCGLRFSFCFWKGFGLGGCLGGVKNGG